MSSGSRVLSITFLILSFFIVSERASAQAAIFATGGSTAFGFSGDKYPDGASFKPNSGGFMVGAHYMFSSFGRLKIGADGRFNFSPGFNGGRAFTGGLRFAWVPRRFPLRPYGGFGAGAVSTQLQPNDRITSGVVRLDAGLDVRLNRVFDIRAFDYEFDSGGTAGLTSAGMHSYSGGIVLHLPGR